MMNNCSINSNSNYNNNYYDNNSSTIYIPKNNTCEDDCYNGNVAPFAFTANNVLFNNVNMNDSNNEPVANINPNKHNTADINSLTRVYGTNPDSMQNTYNVMTNVIAPDTISNVQTTNSQYSPVIPFSPLTNNNHSDVSEENKKQYPDNNINKPITVFDEAERNGRLHINFKALSKPERQLLVQHNAVHSDLLRRTIHLRFLPLIMKQSELASLCGSCGVYLRVRICGNGNSHNYYNYKKNRSRLASQLTYSCNNSNN